MPDPQSDNEKKLLQSASQGDQPAFTELFRIYRNKLFGFLFKLTGSLPLTEDIVQEIFFQLWKDRNKLKDIGSLNAYLFRMARNEAFDAFRRTARETLIKNGFAADNTDNNHAVEQKELQQVIDKAVTLLPRRQQLIYKLSREENLKHGEIASRLGITPGTVNNHMIQALKTIREHLQHYHNPLIWYIFLSVIEAFQK